MKNKIMQQYETLSTKLLKLIEIFSTPKFKRHFKNTLIVSITPLIAVVFGLTFLYSLFLYSSELMINKIKEEFKEND